MLQSFNQDRRLDHGRQAVSLQEERQLVTRSHSKPESDRASSVPERAASSTGGSLAPGGGGAGEVWGLPE